MNAETAKQFVNYSINKKIHLSSQRLRASAVHPNYQNPSGAMKKTVLVKQTHFKISTNRIGDLKPRFPI